ncbi:MAG: leucine--tRNA ligase [Candidatus Lokiarchaeota archaeon]|nr:leucine--tRNA ligase [Candidatus Lokiarchaeota archaeon]
MDLVAIEKKWQEKWAEAKIFEADPDPKRKKKFITIPYPYTSGTTHIGHGRSYTGGDIFTRYYRAKGFNTLLPMAFHITGTPVLAISSSIERGDSITIDRMNEYVSLHTKDPKKVDEIVKSFVDPWNVVKYFSKTMKMDFQTIGISLDWRREFTTGDKIYNKFIEWQYYKFHELGYLIKGEYPILFCPRDNQAVGEDDISAGDEVSLEINEYICIKFPFEDGYMVPATLRPETHYGVTNMWLHPDGNYVKVEVNDEKWIVSKEAVEVLKGQNKKIGKILKTFKGIDLIGKKCRDVLDTRDIPILPGEFVDTAAATGVVYSVPAHAPYDYIALIDLQKDSAKLKKFKLNEEEIRNIKPIKMITLEGFTDYPAKVYCEKHGVTSQLDADKLDKATAEIYKNEFYNGILDDICKGFEKKKVNEVKNLLIADLSKKKKVDKMYQPITRNLKCKCGEQIIVSVLKDQWFLDFNAGDWKTKALKLLEQLIIVPNKYRLNFENVFSWLDKRPCARKRGLGTHLQFDREWIIESLSDSTIYMSFYTIAHHINNNGIKPEQLIPEFFDYVYLDKGNLTDLAKKTNIDEQLLKIMHDEFMYWYPVDHRHTAIMHISNHLSFFLFHHAAIFPEKHWPKAITLIEPVIVAGQKMGKSKGNVIPIAEIQTRYSADLFRFYISHTADLGVKVDWRENEVQAVKNHIIRFFNFIKDNNQKIKALKNKKITLKSSFSRYIVSSCIQKFIECDKALSEFNIRRYLQLSFYETFNILQDFQKNHFDEKEVLEAFRIIFPTWVQILSLAIPHVCEELWEMLGNKNFISKTVWEPFNKKLIDMKLEYDFQFIKNLVDDITNIKNALKKEQFNKIYLYTTSEWKKQAYDLIIEKKGEMKEIMGEAKKNTDLIKNKELVPYIKTMIKERIWEKNIELIDEVKVLTEYKNYLEKKFNTNVLINSDFDPKNRARNAVPMKPSIYVEE